METYTPLTRTSKTDWRDIYWNYKTQLDIALCFIAGVLIVAPFVLI